MSNKPARHNHAQATMSQPTVPDNQLKLEFETPQFLHSLFANDAREVSYIEQSLGVRVVTRDGWILFSGPREGLDLAKKLFADLEEARRSGVSIHRRDFRQAVDMVAGRQSKGLSDLAATRLLGSRTRKPVTPRSPCQLEYLKAMESHPVVFGIGPAGTCLLYTSPSPRDPT